ncbi:MULTISPECIES: acetylornithine deacetylase [Legionella]|uniref:Acetylornithine deacetylase n=1 Tax=Legionella drozanskii LLAP-1 TaxID=1212489 RepID=A0A0W0SW39_9GAMM|nr:MULTISPECIES: acetylornithine deacetylase [Legionella]KTC87500.1 acetylornithine deacetylase [Legionella drozanskii LLAP-1]PJE10467.1 MAG: acetylornithine deacetylase [Legionella sp.]
MNTQQWLEKLISIDTISNNSNLELIETIASWLKLHDVQFHIIPSPDGSKANLFASIPTKDDQITGGLVFAGHTDVVPVAGQMWDTNPFVATEKNGKIYGRGACDMKGFIAVILALIPKLKKLTLLKPIHFAFTYDEEIGCIGVDFLLDYIKKLGIKPEGCIVGEPSNMRPIIGEKARRVYHCQIQGWSAHSSIAAKGCNAIEYASRLICYIHKFANYLKENGPFDYDFDYPFTTVSTNIVSGGIAYNVIPGTCEFILEIRYLPQFPLENFRSQIENYINKELLPEMKKNYSEAAIYLEEISDASGFVALEDTPLIRLVRSITGVKDRLKVSYSTEAGIYQDANIPTVVCGPGHIDQAHQPNEFIANEQLIICEKVIKNLINLFCLDLKNH